MTHIRDLARVSYSSFNGPIRAVGWLESSKRFKRGSVDAEFTQRLIALIERPIAGLFALGMHWCSLCTSEGKIGPDCRSSQNVLLVPAPSCVYETPIWIGHYILAHSYQPPDEFCRAVISCPEPGSEEYRSALLAHLPELGSFALDGKPFFGTWDVQRTLQPDPEHGDEKAFEALMDEERRKAEPPPTRDQIIEEHGGLSDTNCAWAGCKNMALAKMAICVDHAYPEVAKQKPWWRLW